jgi:hypothetical protein
MQTTINNLTVISNLGNVLLKEHIIGGGTQSTYIAQTIAFDKGAYTFVECEFNNEQTEAAFDNNPVHGTFKNARQADEAAFNFSVQMIAELNAILEAIADAANEVLHTAIAEQADLANEVYEAEATILELDLVPENADLELQYEALQAGAAFDNVEPTPAFSLHYEMPTNIYDLDELSNVIAEEEWRALGTVDVEINALKAKLIQLNDKRIGIVEECAHWRGKCERAIEIAEYEQNYDSNEAQEDLRQSIWLSTGQDIM